MYTIRPSKKFLYRFLKKNLSLKRYKIGFDIASVAFKMLPYFKNCHYIGVDKEYELVKSFLSIFNKKKLTGIVKDITEKKKIGQGIADIVVSTNTLHWIKSSKKKKLQLNT